MISVPGSLTSDLQHSFLFDNTSSVKNKDDNKCNDDSNNNNDN